MGFLLAIGVAMFAGLFISRLTVKLNLPDVTSYLVAADFGAEGAMVRNIVLFSVLIYEPVGPMLTKLALTKAGEIHPKPTQTRGQGVENPRTLPIREGVFPRCLTFWTVGV